MPYFHNPQQDSFLLFRDPMAGFVPDVGDTTKPVITMLGSPLVLVPVGETYTDEGAIATDDVDGDITADIVTDNPVNSEMPGLYIVSYNVQDAAGNFALPVFRQVAVLQGAISPVAFNDSYEWRVDHFTRVK